jgi:hypothetical protein
MRFASRLLTLTGLAATVLAVPAAASTRVEPGAEPIELVAPRSGDTLAAGATAEVSWAPLARYAALRGIEEWEAFLSVDGGKTYPLRITPHLDADLRRFSWQVPPVPTTDARLLLRLGDEHRETVVVLPQRFSIVLSPLTAAAPAALLEVPAPARGEKARPDVDKDDDDDDDGVVAWVEGSRRGGALRQRVAVASPGFQTRIQPVETKDEAAEIARGSSFPLPELNESPTTKLAALRGSRLAGPRDIRPFAFDILLLTQRQNE